MTTAFCKLAKLAADADESKKQQITSGRSFQTLVGASKECTCSAALLSMYMCCAVLWLCLSLKGTPIAVCVFHGYRYTSGLSDGAFVPCRYGAPWGSPVSQSLISAMTCASV